MDTVRKHNLTDEVTVGTFTKQEAGRLIAQGTRHVHSGESLPAAWEPRDTKEFFLSSSAERADLFQRIIADSGVKRSEVIDRIKLILEELTTNAIFHSYHVKGGARKYPRLKPAELTPNEKISVKFKTSDKGVYLCVEDHGGSLNFETVREVFERCYGSQSKQIANKESGAGLGIYMVFEMVGHLKITTEPGKSTMVCCWLPTSRTYDPKNFTFDFFERR